LDDHEGSAVEDVSYYSVGCPSRTLVFSLSPKEHQESMSSKSAVSPVAAEFWDSSMEIFFADNVFTYAALFNGGWRRGTLSKA
jgi:hypothetical protein